MNLLIHRLFEALQDSFHLFKKVLACIIIFVLNKCTAQVGEIPDHRDWVKRYHLNQSSVRSVLFIPVLEGTHCDASLFEYTLQIFESELSRINKA
jgi:hypothetical protein